MGERNNGYGGYGELRRTGRTQGTWRQDGGYRRTGNDNDCGICRLFGGNDARYGERYGERDGCGCSQQRTGVSPRESRQQEDGCGCSQQRTGVSTRESRQQGDGCGCSQQRTGVSAREGRRTENGCGCGCGCGSDARVGGSCVKGECHALMKKLQQLDFAIQETVLYLDAYPDCCEALALYRQLIEQRCEVAKQYESECGPLTGHGGKTEQYWDWIGTPWPWNPDFPGNGTGHRS